MTKFRIRVDGGEPRDLVVETGIYRDAAAAVPAILGLDLPIDVEIWVDDLVGAGYGPYCYRVQQNQFVGLETRLCTLPSRLNSPQESPAHDRRKPQGPPRPSAPARPPATPSG